MRSKTMYFDGICRAQVIKKKTYFKPKQSYYMQFVVPPEMALVAHPIFESWKNIKGARRGSVVLSFRSYDYTREHENRKVAWKLGIRKEHISKVYLLTAKKAWADIKDTEDVIVLLSASDWSYEGLQTIDLLIAKGKRGDHAFLNMFTDGELDEEIEALRQALPKEPQGAPI